MKIRRHAMVLCLFVAAGGVAACGSSSSGGGTGGQSGTGGNAGGTGGAGGGGGPACPGAVVMPTVDCPTTDVLPPMGNFPNDAACGEEGKATATSCMYDGYEDFKLVNQSGLGDPVCVVRFTVKRVGNAPAGCASCAWTQTVEYSNPTIMTNVNGACANSGYGLDDAKIAQINGCKTAIGFEPKCLDHDGNCRWKYSVAMQKWQYASGVSFCSAEEAAAGNCAPANSFNYTNNASCSFQ